MKRHVAIILGAIGVIVAVGYFYFQPEEVDNSAPIVGTPQDVLPEQPNIALSPEILEWCAINNIPIANFPFNFAHHGHGKSEDAVIEHAAFIQEKISGLMEQGLVWPRRRIMDEDLTLEHNLRMHESRAIAMIANDPAAAVHYFEKQIIAEEGKYAMRDWRQTLQQTAAAGVSLSVDEYHQALQRIPDYYLENVVAETLAVDARPVLVELCLEHANTLEDKYRLPALAALLSVDALDTQTRQQIAVTLADILNLDQDFSSVHWADAVSTHLLGRQAHMHSGGQ